jgi:sulfite exporter TauE/SafE
MKISNGKIQALALCGILSPIVYVVTVALGGILDPSYSHIGKTVSELVEMGAPNRDLLNVLLVVYNVLIIPFAVGLYFGLKKGVTRSLVLVALVLTGIFGTAVTVFFPLDAAGQSVTFTGMMHLVVVGLVVPCTFVFMLGFWDSGRKDESWGKLGLFSIAVFVVTLISGIATAAFVNSDYRGLLERITIGSTLVWIEVVAIKLYTITKRKLTSLRS